MAKRRVKKRKKDSLNVATLSSNARRTAAIYGLGPLGARGWDGTDQVIDPSVVVTNPRAVRKKRTELFR